MIDQVFARAVMLAGEPDGHQQELLRVLCASCITTLEARLKDGLTAEDCGESFLTAASLLALAAMGSFGTEVQEFKAGDLTVKTGNGGASGLERQAQALMAPYLKDRFLFAGV